MVYWSYNIIFRTKTIKIQTSRITKGLSYDDPEFYRSAAAEYINSGLTRAPVHSGHPNRKNIGIFDLLVVMKATPCHGERHSL